MISVNGVSFAYVDGTDALEGVSVDFPEEHIFAVLGQSGSGKTTLLNCMARFLFPQTGSILIDGLDIRDMSETDFRAKVGVVFQRLNLFPHLTICENMTLAPCKVQKRRLRDTRKDAEAMLDRLGIADLADSYPSQVSGGQAQRAAIARGLMLAPRYMLLDEPTSALDAGTTSEFAEWLRELNGETNFIIVTHDLLFAEQVATHGVFMNSGSVTHTGRIADILEIQGGNGA